MSNNKKHLEFEDYEIRLLLEAVDRSEMFYDQDLKRNQSFLEQTHPKDTREVIQKHIERDIYLVGYFQRIRETINKQLESTIIPPPKLTEPTT